jgi:prepilin-type N-terminal cleavage/methylation domain-containing protein
MSKNVLRYVHRQPRPAFTVVELLVVIAIIGVMVGMLLPAVGAVRDSARRTQNENNLKQLGTAIMSFEGQHGTYPAMVKPSVEDPSDLTKSVSWAFQILPFLEQEVVYNKYDAKQSCFTGTNLVATATPIESLVNPRRRDARSVSPYLTMTSARGAPLDYAGNGGVVVDDRRNAQVLPADPARIGNSIFPFDRPFDPRYSGPFHPSIAVPSAAVRDGLSNTLCVGDRWINPAALGRMGSMPSPPRSMAMHDLAGLAGDSYFATVRFANVDDQSNQAFPISKTDTSVFKFGSPKGNDACFAFLDGHVRWLPYDINLLVFQNLSAINDGNVIPANQLP